MNKSWVLYAIGGALLATMLGGRGKKLPKAVKGGAWGAGLALLAGMAGVRLPGLPAGGALRK